MKKLQIKTDRHISDKNSFEVAIDDSYYDFIEEEFKKITNTTGIVETKALISALISKIIEKRQIEKEIDSLYDRLS